MLILSLFNKLWMTTHKMNAHILLCAILILAFVSFSWAQKRRRLFDEYDDLFSTTRRRPNPTRRPNPAPGGLQRIPKLDNASKEHIKSYLVQYAPRISTGFGLKDYYLIYKIDDYFNYIFPGVIVQHTQFTMIETNCQTSSPYSPTCYHRIAKPERYMQCHTLMIHRNGQKMPELRNVHCDPYHNS